MQVPIVHPIGESGLLVFFGNSISAQINARAHAFARGLRDSACKGVTDIVPAYVSVLVRFDPLAVAAEELRELIGSLAHDLPAQTAQAGQTHVIPVHYGGTDGPDLERVARAHDLTPDQVIGYHSDSVYRVFFLGFMPGFAYMGAVPEQIATPRLSTPRVRVPMGSVGIADAQTGVYPFSSPGGWNILGRTALPLWDPARENPALLAAGDTVRFAPSDTQPEPTPPAPMAPEPKEPAFKVSAPGALTSVQDLGRPGNGAVGLCQGGVMDPEAAIRANALVGNPSNAAVLELTFTGPELLALKTVCVALAGADLECTIDGMPVPTGISWLVREGSVVRFAQRPRRHGGMRSWLAVSGGIDVPEVLGSRSTYLPAAFGGYAGRPLRTGDILGVSTSAWPPAELAGRVWQDEDEHVGGEEAVLRVVRYSGLSCAPPEAAAAVLSRTWTVSEQTDRMGARLRAGDASSLATGSSEVLSFGVVRGALQLPPGGDPVILNADHQTTGGYPVVGVVAQADWPRLAQVAPGTRVRFEEVSVDGARRALTGRYSDLQRGLARPGSWLG